MDMSNVVPSLIRTYVPLGVGVLLSWLVTKGITVNPQAQAGLIALLTAALTALYYTVVRLVEHRYPAVGTVLLGLGIKSKPAYAKPGDPAVPHPMGERAPPLPPARP